MSSRKTMMIVALVALLAFFAGCEEMKFDNQSGQWNKTSPTGTPAASNQPRSVRPGSHLAGQAVRGSHDNAAPGATQAAMNWMRKSAELSQEVLYANKRITNLQAENKRLQGQINTLNAQITNYKREIRDANAMLDEMKKDLRQWRASVLGMRKEQMATMNALLVAQKKILELLGGEVGANRKR